MSPPMTTETVDTPARRQARTGLVRELGTIDATMIVMGAMIGSGIFITSAESARLVGAPGWLLAAWALAGLMTISGAICAAEIAAMMPRAGGQYVFLREAYSPMFGFLFGWAMFLVVQTGTIAAVAVAFAKFLGVFCPAIAAEPIRSSSPIRSLRPLRAEPLHPAARRRRLDRLPDGRQHEGPEARQMDPEHVHLHQDGRAARPDRRRPDAGRNCESGRLDVVMVEPDGQRLELADRLSDGRLPVEAGPALMFLLGLAMIGPLFSQSAWNNVTFTGGETRDPAARFRAPDPGHFSVVAALPAGERRLRGLAALCARFSTRRRTGWEPRPWRPSWARGAGYAWPAAILISTFGCVNGLVLAGARVYYAMARDGLFFRSVGTTNRITSRRSRWRPRASGRLLLALPVTVTTDRATQAVKYGNLYNELLEYIIPVDVTFYTLMVGAVIALRHQGTACSTGPYRTIAYPLPALIYIGLAVLLVLDFIYLKPKTSGIGFLIVLAGIPVYLIWQRSRPRQGLRSQGRRSNLMRAER